MKNQEIEWLLTEKYRGEKTPEFFADVIRLENGEPLAYVIGHMPFLGCTIYLDSKPLIPRPETEFWVEKAIQALLQTRSGRSSEDNHSTPLSLLPRKDLGKTPAPTLYVLDLCAGSGAIGIAVANAVQNTHVTFGEIDATHLPTIFKNLEVNNITCTRYRAFESDLFKNISGQFDFILTNPPYIDQSANTAEKSVTDFEPYLALFGGNNGLEIIEKIIMTAPTHLKPTGQLWLEHEPSQVEAIKTIAKKHNLTCVTHLDQYNTPRYSVLSMAQ